MRNKEKKRPSVSHRIRILLIVIIPLFITLTLVSIRMLRNTREQTELYLENTMNLYVSEIDSTVTNLNRRLRNILLGSGLQSQQTNEYMMSISEHNNQAMVFYSINQLKTIFVDLVQEYGKDKNYFLFLSNSDQYIRLTDSYLTQREYQDYEHELMVILHNINQMPAASLRTWQSIHVDNRGSALYKIYQKDGISLGCWIRSEDLVSPLNQMDFGNDGYVSILDKQGNILAAPYSTENANKKQWFPTIMKANTTITRSLNCMPFRVSLNIQSYGKFETVLYIQMLMVILLGIIIICLSAGLFYMQRRILKPIRNFYKNIQQIEAGYGHIADLSHNDLIELDKANAEFIKLLNERERLQATIYKQNVEKQTIEMDYLKVQIKPHFYLNCLNFIYNMIDLGEYDNGKKMCSITADYMRYLFQSSDQFVTVADELKHVKDYLEIQKLRYGNVLTFSFSIDRLAEGQRIPTLVIQTFVENAVKHALSLDKNFDVIITVRVIGENEHRKVAITVSDNGEGFSPETLRKLRSNISLRDEHQGGVGIDNCMKRLYHVYGTKTSINFSNAADGGAIIEILIPYTEPEKQGRQS